MTLCFVNNIILVPYDCSLALAYDSFSYEYIDCAHYHSQRASQAFYSPSPPSCAAFAFASAAAFFFAMT